MKSLSDYEIPVFKGFQQEDLIMGVQKGIFLGLLLMFIIIWYLFGTFIAIPITVVIYVPCYFVTKHDPNMLSIAIGSIFTEPDELEG